MASELDAQGDIEISDDSATDEEEDRAASQPEKKEGDDDPDKKKGSESETEAGAEKPGDETKPGDKPEDQQQQSKYAKERERQDRSWKALNEEKEAVRKEREALEAERRALEEKRREVEKPAESKDDAGYTASDYERAAKKFREDGDDAFAQRAEAKAKAMREADQKAQGQASQEKFREVWQGHVAELLKERPELEDQSHPLSQAVQKLLKEDRLFSMIPDGFRRAVELADLREKAGLVSSLEKKAAELQSEITRLNGLTQPGGSGPTSKPKAKRFEDLSSEEQDAELLRQAREADSLGEPVISQ